jgi:pilus assembly protein Flp/PilA
MQIFTMIAAYLKTRENDDEGATAVEYTLLVTFIAIAIIVGMTAFGKHINDVFTGLSGKF